MKIRDVIRLIEQDGWQSIGQEGSHRHFKHPNNPGRVAVAGHPGQDLHPKTLKSILRQAGLERER